MQKKETPLRHCKNCGKRLSRKVYATKVEAVTTFERRRFCNHRCRGAFRRQCFDDSREQRVCGFCDKPLPLRIGNGDPTHSRFCSGACAGRSRGLDRQSSLPDKFCESCQKPLVLRYRETTKMFQRRRFCGYRCRGCGLGQNYNGDLKVVGKRACQYCGSIYAVLTGVFWRQEGFCSRRCFNVVKHAKEHSI